jgi:hypothetical protein
MMNTVYIIITWYTGVDVSAYLLLYGISLYNVEKEDLIKLNIEQNEQIMIRRAKYYLSLMYKCYIKHLIGSHASANPQLDERNILNQMQECSLILTKRNLHLNDMTDSHPITVSKV